MVTQKFGPLFVRIIITLFLLNVNQPVLAETTRSTPSQLKIAVASNFRAVMQKLVPLFEKQYPVKVTWTSASSGALYTQITQGAPIDLFLSADSARPQKLIAQNMAEKNSLTTYALGQLAWYQPGMKEKPFVKPLHFVDTIVIANPKLAPYGQAALTVIQHLKQNGMTFQQTIQASNILQAFQYIQTGNIKAGFIAYSQIKQQDIKSGYWLIPQSWHQPIQQQAVILKATHREEARKFLIFLQTPATQKIINTMGYQTP